jgi:Flp pilus assembly protein TadD
VTDCTAKSPQGLAEWLPLLSDPGVNLRGGYDRKALAAARREFEAALELYPHHPIASAGLALTELRDARISTAARLVESALAEHEGDAVLLLPLGNVRFVQEEYDRAESHYRSVLERRPDWPFALKNLALTLEARGKSEDARAAWQDLSPYRAFRAEALTRLDDEEDEAP